MGAGPWGVSLLTHPAHPREGLPALGITSSAAAQSSCECLARFSLPAVSPQPSCHAVLLHPGKVLPAPRLSGVHRAMGSSPQWAPGAGSGEDAPTIISAALGLPLHPAGTATVGWALGHSPPTALPHSSPGLTLPVPHSLITSCASARCCVIVPRYLATKPPCCLPAPHLPASCWHAGVEPGKGGSTSAGGQSGKPPCQSGQHSPQGHRAATGSWHANLRPLRGRAVPATHPPRGKGGRASAGKQGGAWGVPAALPCGHWRWDILPLVALSRVLPKHTLSPVSTEGCKPGKDPTNLQAPWGFVGAWDDDAQRKDGARWHCHQSPFWGPPGTAPQL